MKHIAWRDGRPRFVPGAPLRQAGYVGTDLRYPADAPHNWLARSLKVGDKNSGAWFSKGEALDWSEHLCAALAKAKKAAPKAKPAPQPAPKKGPRTIPPAPYGIYTVAHLVEEWFRKSLKFQLPEDQHELMRERRAGNVYSPKTVKDYRQKMTVLEMHDPEIWGSPADALSQQVLLGLYEDLVVKRGRATARGVIATLSIAISWAKRRGKLTLNLNPAQDMEMQLPAPRARFASKAEIAALIACADALGWPEMADMITLGLWTGQRQEDRLLLEDRGLINNRRIFRQRKTGAVVAIFEAPELTNRLAKAQTRRRLAGIVNPRLVIDEQVYATDEETGRPRAAWEPFPDDGDRYRKRFVKLRKIAAEGLPDKGIAAAPTLLGDKAAGVLPMQEKDLRATAVTWMGMAGATIPEIISVTGHTAQSATTILKHYLQAHPDMADTAIAKMVQFYDSDREASVGL